MIAPGEPASPVDPALNRPAGLPRFRVGAAVRSAAPKIRERIGVTRVRLPEFVEFQDPGLAPTTTDGPMTPQVRSWREQRDGAHITTCSGLHAVLVQSGTAVAQDVRCLLLIVIA